MLAEKCQQLKIILQVLMVMYLYFIVLLQP